MKYNYKYILFIFIILNSPFCTDKSSDRDNKMAYCPLKPFYIPMGEGASNSCEYEVTVFPCIDTFELKHEFLLSVKKDGIAKIILDGNLVLLRPSTIRFENNTPFWTQDFFNDQYDIRLSVENKVLSKSKRPRNYTYDSSLKLILRDSIYKYDVRGFCDSSFVDSLRKVKS